MDKDSIYIPFSTHVWENHISFYTVLLICVHIQEQPLNIFPVVFPLFTQTTPSNIKTELSGSAGLAVLLELSDMKPPDGLQTSSG